MGLSKRIAILGNPNRRLCNLVVIIPNFRNLLEENLFSNLLSCAYVEIGVGCIQSSDDLLCSSDLTPFTPSHEVSLKSLEESSSVIQLSGSTDPGPSSHCSTEGQYKVPELAEETVHLNRRSPNGFSSTFSSSPLANELNSLPPVLVILPQKSAFPTEVSESDDGFLWNNVNPNPPARSLPINSNHVTLSPRVQNSKNPSDKYSSEWDNSHFQKDWMLH